MVQIIVGVISVHKKGRDDLLGAKILMIYVESLTEVGLHKSNHLFSFNLFQE
jgi:hypothetical protein